MKTRECKSAAINTGSSMCPIDWGKIRGAILVEPGNVLDELTKDKLEELCHADRPGRIYPIVGFVEYAKNGGEAQTSAVGYGPSEYNGLSQQTDTFTLSKFDETLNANLLKGANKKWDVYFFDDKHLYGYNNGTALAGIPMSCVYPTATQFSTSSNKSSLTVSFSYEDIEDALLHLDFTDIEYTVFKGLKGLTGVKLVKLDSGDNDYKLVEAIGGYDVTALFGDTLSTDAATAMTGVTAVKHDKAKNVLTMTPSTGAIGLAAPSKLFTSKIKWIESV